MLLKISFSFKQLPNRLLFKHDFAHLAVLVIAVNENLFFFKFFSNFLKFITFYPLKSLAVCGQILQLLLERK